MEPKGVVRFRAVRKLEDQGRGELVSTILLLVGAGVAVGAVAALAPNTLQLIEYLDPKGRPQRRKIWNAIQYLEKKGDISVEAGKDGKEYVTLTRQGKMRYDEDQLWSLEIRKPRMWDRKWRLVMFDFPSRSRTRHAFRAKLEDFGFILYQRSVFIYPYECHDEVMAVARWYGLDDYVRYIVATEIHDMRRFAKEFDLL